MPCDDRKVGIFNAILCEYTKAYVRCFPLLGLIVSILVASRMLLQQRAYYEMLSHGTLITFEKFQPFKDPLFLILAWCMSNAFFHFALDIWVAHEFSFNIVEDLSKFQAQEFQHQIHRVAIFYVAPSMLFMLFLWTSYDTELVLLPLNKYFEDDSDAARRTLSEVTILPEDEAARIINQGLIYHGLDETNLTIEDLCDNLAALATDPGLHSPNQVEAEHLSSWRLMSTLWPAKFMLDPRLKDDDSIHFRHVWYIFLLGAFSMIAVVFYFFAWITYKDVNDILEGQLTDTSGMIVELAHSSMTAFLAYHFLDTISVPWTLARRKSDDLKAEGTTQA